MSYPARAEDWISLLGSTPVVIAATVTAQQLTWLTRKALALLWSAFCKRCTCPRVENEGSKRNHLWNSRVYTQFYLASAAYLEDLLNFYCGSVRRCSGLHPKGKTTVRKKLSAWSCACFSCDSLPRSVTIHRDKLFELCATNSYCRCPCQK